MPRSLLLAACLLLSSVSARADEPLDGPGLSEFIESIDDVLQMRKGNALPELTDSDFEKLAGGGTVIKQQEMEGSEMLGATVFRVTDVEAWRIWLAICDRDHHEEFMPHIKEGVCLEDFGESRLVYQYLALPAVKDRHWIIRTRTNGPMWLQSGKSVWESYWELEPDAETLIDGYLEKGAIEAVTSDQVESAIVTPINNGCWLLVDLPDGRCFIGYQDMSDIGGKLPAWIVNEVGPGGLKNLVIEVEARGRAIEQHFSGDRTPPKAPDGSDVEQFRLP